MPDKINEEREDLNNSVNQLDITDIYRTLHSVTAGYTFFWGTHGILSRTEHMLNHRTSFNKFERI